MNMKKPLIEKIDSHLSYVAESSNSEKFIGKLHGVCADYMSPTRNGRKYPKELWERVIASDTFKEAMDTLTCFGECDHPSEESGRIDTSIKEIAIVLTELNINEADGKVYGTFGILDTPNGRILKTLLEAGCKIGVSSRGLGDEIVVSGEPIIDPETYEFFGFDAVVMPAVATARPGVMESAKHSLAESFRREIDNATCAAELESIKRIAETANVPDLDSIKESIDIKLNSNKEDNISEKLEDELGRVARDNEELKSKIQDLEEKLRCNNITLKNMSKKMNEDFNKSVIDSNRLKKSIKMIESLQDHLFESANQMEEMTNLRESEAKRFRIQLNNAKSSNRKLESRNIEMANNIKELKRSNSSLVEENSKLKSDLKSMAILESKNKVLENKLSILESNRRKLENIKSDEVSSLSKKLESLSRESRETINQYLKVKCTQEGLDISAVLRSLPKKFNLEDINKIVSEFSDRKRRLDKVPVYLKPRSISLSESVISDEDRQTMEIIQANIPKVYN